MLDWSQQPKLQLCFFHHRNQSYKGKAKRSIFFIQKEEEICVHSFHRWNPTFLPTFSWPRACNLPCSTSKYSCLITLCCALCSQVRSIALFIIVQYEYNQKYTIYNWKVSGPNHANLSHILQWKRVLLVSGFREDSTCKNGCNKGKNIRKKSWWGFLFAYFLKEFYLLF